MFFAFGFSFTLQCLSCVITWLIIYAWHLRWLSVAHFCRCCFLSIPPTPSTLRQKWTFCNKWKKNPRLVFYFFFFGKRRRVSTMKLNLINYVTRVVGWSRSRSFRLCSFEFIATLLQAMHSKTAKRTRKAHSQFTALLITNLGIASAFLVLVD
jgi:hypothetical protein